MASVVVSGALWSSLLVLSALQLLSSSVPQPSPAAVSCILLPLGQGFDSGRSLQRFSRGPCLMTRFSSCRAGAGSPCTAVLTAELTTGSCEVLAGTVLSSVSSGTSSPENENILPSSSEVTALRT